MTAVDWLEIIRDRIVRDFSPEKLILFGSQARGQATPHSDIDLLVVFAEVKDKRRIAVDIHRCLADLPVGTDILITTPEEISRRGWIVGTILRSALHEGKVIYER